jgi:hypothetical protein
MLMALCVGTMGAGCSEAQRKSFAANSVKFMEYLEKGQEKTDEALEVAGAAMERLDAALKRAESDEPVKLPTGDDAVTDLVDKGADAAKPFVPYPFNYLLTLIPAVVGWLRAKSKEKRREMEEALLVLSLQRLKKEDRATFDKVMKYRDMVSQGLMTAKEFATYLQGINEIRAKYSTPT